MSRLRANSVVLIRKHHDFTIAKVSIVREGSISAFPWDEQKRDFQAGIRRFGKWQIVGFLSRRRNPATVSKHIANLREGRDQARRSAQEQFVKQIQQIVMKEPSDDQKASSPCRTIP